MPETIFSGNLCRTNVVLNAVDNGVDGGQQRTMNDRAIILDREAHANIVRWERSPSFPLDDPDTVYRPDIIYDTH